MRSWKRVIPTLVLLPVLGAAAKPSAGHPQERNQSGATTAATTAAAADALHGLDAALKALTARVAPAVVQVLVSGYGPTGDDEDESSGVISREQSVGSGVIVDDTGYIVTNAHVVKGADRIEVLVTRPKADVDTNLPAASEQSLIPAFSSASPRISTSPS